MKTKQLKVWTGNFGKEYTDRNTQTVSGLDRDYKEELGVSATALFKGGLYGETATKRRRTFSGNC